MRLTPTLSKAATSSSLTTTLANLPALKATQLKALARATGIPSSGRKDVLRKRIGAGVGRSVFLNHNHNHNQKQDDCTAKREKERGLSLSVLSIDMGIQNLAVAHLLVGPPSSSSALGGGGGGKKGMVSLNAWHRIGVQELLSRQRQDSGSEEEALQSILPAAAFRTFSAAPAQTPKHKGKEKTDAEEEAEEEEEKNSFTPETLSLNAYTLLSALLKAYNPTHILIERQRFRSGGQRAVLEWSLRVGVFEGMVHAVLRTMRETQSQADKMEVYGVSPARVMQFWDDGSSNETDGGGVKGAKRVKKLKMDIIGELLSSSSSSSKSRCESGSESGYESRIGELSSWELDVNTSTTQKVVDAYLARWGGSGSSSKGKKKKDESTERIEKLDDLADCLLQGLTWLEWQARRARIADGHLPSL
jgi:cruciform cutting endonuclease 1